ncbi:hypothetical protein [Xanthomonas graminis]|uniref:Putative membrane protein n=1 Tax=Xanthomonas graminis pv. phlei TaxID=487906 RepID=A0A0K2ZM66_9XANT|nr:hypothetical protein [Xanthomonas translucens]CTP84485.1 putative membrane protein [Xanthomonas translucens pv. phlei]
MIGYYLHLALRSFGRNKILTTLMVLAVALGIGASMTMLTVLHTLYGDPCPAAAPRCSIRNWTRVRATCRVPTASRPTN